MSVKHSRCLQPLPGGGRPVGDAAAAPVGGGGVADDLLGWGEEVRPQRHQLPQLVEQLQLRAGVVAPVERVLAHHMVVLRLHMRLVVLLARPRAGLLYVAGLQPRGDLMTDELTPTVGFPILSLDDLVGLEAKPTPGPSYTGFRTRPWPYTSMCNFLDFPLESTICVSYASDDYAVSQGTPRGH